MCVRVKICGITRLPDAWAAVEAGADALGFMFYSESPRCVSYSTAAGMIRELPPLVARVGVFVNPTEAEVRQAIAETGIDTLQFHGDESPKFCRQFATRFIKAFRIRDHSSLKATEEFPGESWLLDAFVESKLGGTGARFNWEIAAAAARLNRKVFLAGGLNPENAAAAVRQVRPYALDVSSGVETAPGQKDPEKIRRFITEAKSA